MDKGVNLLNHNFFKLKKDVLDQNDYSFGMVKLSWVTVPAGYKFILLNFIESSFKNGGVGNIS